MNDLEILDFGYENRCEVWDYYGNRVFEGTLEECEDFIADYEE